MSTWKDATAVWDGQRWQVTVHGLPKNRTGTTEGQDRTEAWFRAREVVGLLMETSVEDVQVSMTWEQGEQER